MCREHSIEFDNSIMSAPGLRDIIDLSLHPMFVGTSFSSSEDGVVTPNCTAASTLSAATSSDCEIAQYFLCAEEGLALPEYDYAWWDFVACMYRNQTALVSSDAADAQFRTVVAGCASSATLSDRELRECFSNHTGAALLERDYESVTSHFSDAVWIIVNGVYVSDNAQWLDAICDAWQGSQPGGCA